MSDTPSGFLPMLIVQLSAIALITVLVFLWPGAWDAWRWAGVLLAVPSSILLVIARWQLGRSFSATPQARELVTHGLYSRIRNPMYLFSGLLVVSFLLVFHKPRYFLILIVLVVAQIIRARREAAVLEARFGDAYRQYRAKTWF
jgi:protein-S-isoprenylcysteine O-methyltransferase Ste14